jgi:TolB protein
MGELNRGNFRSGWTGVSTGNASFAIVPSSKHKIRILLAFVCFLSGCGRQGPPQVPSAGIAFVSDRDGNWEIYTIQANGTGLSRLTDHPAVDADPNWSPDGSQIVFRSRRDGSSDLFVMAAGGGNPTNLIRDPLDSFDDEFAPAWNPDGEWFALYTDRFPAALECPTGVHRLALFPFGGRRDDIQLLDIPPGQQESFAWSPDGLSLAYTSGCGAAEPRIYVWERESGQTRPLLPVPSLQANPAWSHDGRYLAFVSNRDGNTDVFKFAFDTGELTNLTQHPALDTQPTWSPDDESIAFVSDRDGNREIYVMGADGSGPQNLTHHPATDWAPAWSPVP